MGGAPVIEALRRCPRCRAPLALPDSGEFRCPACRKAFHFFRVQVPVMEVPFAPEAPSGSRCAEHAGNPAVGLCERCGDFLCDLCRTPIEGRVYCPNCFDLLHERGAFQFSQAAFVAPGVAMNLAMLAYLALLVPGLNVVLAGLAIVNGLNALKRIQEKPDLPGRDQAIAAIGMAGFNLALFLGLLRFVFPW